MKTTADKANAGCHEQQHQGWHLRSPEDQLLRNQATRQTAHASHSGDRRQDVRRGPGRLLTGSKRLIAGVNA
jgi:hypothetical protein